jgi:3-hydroxyisobutyrate dehydrogenase
MATIGFIGLGNMGGPMAANLVKAGHLVRGFDLVPRARDAAGQAGVVVVASAAAAAEGADLVITMLPAGPHVRDIYDDPAGPLAVAAKGTLFIECSTIDVETARAIHTASAAAGMASLDAPVSGGVVGATAATLTFMVGGDAAAFARARPVLESMGRKIVHCGGATAGQAAKICNNMILGVSMIAISEAFVLAEKLGLSHQALFDVVSMSSGQCWSLSNYCPVPGPVPSSPANNSFKPGFATALMVKDLTLAQEAAKAAGAETALGRHAAEIYTRFAQEGHAGMDFSGIINSIRAWSGDGGAA